MISRRQLCLSALSALVLRGAAVAAHPGGYRDDFDLLWRTLDARYAFFGEKATDWPKVREVYAPRAAAAVTKVSFAEVLQQMLSELYDAHTHLNEPAEGTPRWPPFDMYVEPHPHGAVVIDVRDGSAAALAGLRPGQIINSIDGVSILEATALHLPACLTRPDQSAEIYALNAAVAGRRGEARAIGLVSGAMLDLPLGNDPGEPDVSFRAIGEFGYIRIASFADEAVVPAFDAALTTLRGAEGLILDVRRNGGGDTAVARPIMGRFIEQRAPYALMRRREGRGLGAAWTEYVEPRGPFSFRRPVVILTDRWSASMAEGFPVGMRGIGRGVIVGRPMMGLGAAVAGIDLPVSGLSVQYSAEPVYDIQGTPRWTLSPDILVAPGGDILSEGVSELRRLVRK